MGQVGVLKVNWIMSCEKPDFGCAYLRSDIKLLEKQKGHFNYGYARGSVVVGDRGRKENMIFLVSLNKRNEVLMGDTIYAIPPCPPCTDIGPNTGKPTYMLCTPISKTDIPVYEL